MPTDDWCPPPGWEPDPEWPPAPTGWRFWTDDRGRNTRGPIGAYGALGAGRFEVASAEPSLLLL
jgi:hypothetical protein